MNIQTKRKGPTVEISSGSRNRKSASAAGRRCSGVPGEEGLLEVSVRKREIRSCGSSEAGGRQGSVLGGSEPIRGC